MRVAVGIHHGNIEKALQTYDLMSNGYFTHATPTLFNSGTPMPQMSSCFLLTMQDDSLHGIYDTLKQCALISKSAGGIGLSIHHIRAKGSYIKGTNGTSNGIVPMLRVFNDTARYVDQGGGKRKGSIAIYLEPWHPDLIEFLDLRKNHGKEEMAPVICSTLYGRLTCLCNVSKPTQTGPSSVQTNVQDYRMHMGRSSSNSTNPTKLKAWPEKLSLRGKSGTRSLRLKSRQEPRTCFTKMLPI